MERWITPDKISYTIEVAEFSENRNLDRYTINDQSVTKEEFLIKRSNAFKICKEIEEISNIHSMKDLKEERIVASILEGKNQEAVQQLNIYLKKKIEAQEIMNKACNEYDKVEKMPMNWQDKATKSAIDLYNASKLLMEQANVYLQRASLLNYFSVLNNNLSLFKERLCALIQSNYFTNLEQAEYEDITEYLIMVFSIKGLRDSIEFLIKMKEANMKYSDKPLVKQSRDGLLIPAAGISFFNFKEQGKDVLLDLNNISISIWNKLNVDEKKETKWHEFSHVLLQPINEIIEDTQIEKLVDDYTFELLDKVDSNRKKS